MNYIFIFLILIFTVAGGFAQQKYPAKPAVSKAAVPQQPGQPKVIKPQVKEAPVQKTAPKKNRRMFAVKRSVKRNPVRRQRSAPAVIIQRSAPRDSLQRPHFQQEGIRFVKPQDNNRR